MESLNFVDRYNFMVGAVISVFTMIFGPQWILFTGFLLFNIVDWLTGWYRARLLHEESSSVGLNGIIKKTLYWILIIVAFMFPHMFISFGQDVLGINLGFLIFVGWLTLGMLIINEARSILENLVQCGVKVPDILIRGLSVTEKLIKAKSENEIGDKDGKQNNGSET